jgi:hypothetical protein
LAVSASASIHPVTASEIKQPVIASAPTRHRERAH